MSGLPTKAQIAKLIATGKVDEVENEGMDEDRYFVHLKRPWSWDDNDGVHRTKSFGNFREAMRELKTVKHESEIER